MKPRHIKFEKMSFAQNRWWISSEMVGTEQIVDEILEELKNFYIRKESKQQKPPEPEFKENGKVPLYGYNRIECGICGKSIALHRCSTKARHLAKLSKKYPKKTSGEFVSL